MVSAGSRREIKRHDSSLALTGARAMISSLSLVLPPDRISYRCRPLSRSLDTDIESSAFTYILLPSARLAIEGFGTLHTAIVPIGIDDMDIW
jgi:hypothetical protein